MALENQEDEPVEELYDFLYRDSNRLASYYAQIFQGNLSSFEENETQTDTKENDLKGDIKVASIGAKTSDAKQASAKRMFDPHDLRTSHVLTFLHDNQFIHTDYVNAPNGAMVFMKGTLFFTDRVILSAAVQAFTVMSQQPEPLFEITQEQMIGIPMVQQMLLDGFFQPICFLQTEDGHTITSTVKEGGLEEPVTTYYLKYGRAGLGDVYIVGLKENSSDLDESKISQMVQSVGELADGLSNFLCGEDSIRVTPLVIFRKFERVKKKKIILGSAARANRD